MAAHSAKYNPKKQVSAILHTTSAPSKEQIQHKEKNRSTNFKGTALDTYVNKVSCFII